MTDRAGSRGSFSHSLQVQMRVLHALLLREVLTRYGRHNLGFLWLFLEPLLVCGAVILVWVFIRERAADTGVPILPFALTGYATVLLWRQGTNRSAGAVDPSSTLLYHRNVQVLDLFLSRMLLEIIGATFSFLVLTCLFIVLDLAPAPRHLFLMIEGWVLLVWFSLGLGLIVGAITEKFSGFRRIWQLGMFVMFPFSGALFMVDWLPSALREIVLWIPTVHVTEMLRHGYIGDSVRTFEDPQFLVCVNIFLLALGLAMIRRTVRMLEHE